MRGRKQIRNLNLWLAALVAVVLCAPAWGQFSEPPPAAIPASQRPPGLKNVAIEQHLNEQLPLDVTFRDETGKTVKLGDYFGKEPVVLSFVYYKCPLLCGEVMAGMASALRVLSFQMGKDYQVVTVSFNPNETPEIATAAKAQYVQRYGKPGAAEGWHFLTGQQASIDKLTKAAGFDYEYDPKSGQYAHATGIMIVTPQGKIAQYYYGVEYPPKDLRLGLIQASQGKIGNLVDQVLLYCYHYDPDTGKYGAIISRVLQLAGAATILVLGGFVIIMFRLGSKHQGV